MCWGKFPGTGNQIFYYLTKSEWSLACFGSGSTIAIPNISLAYFRALHKPETVSTSELWCGYPPCRLKELNGMDLDMAAMSKDG